MGARGFLLSKTPAFPRDATLFVEPRRMPGLSMERTAIASDTAWSVGRIPFRPSDAVLHPAGAVAALVGATRWAAHGSGLSRPGVLRRDNLNDVKADGQDDSFQHCAEYGSAAIHPRDFTSNS